MTGSPHQPESVDVSELKEMGHVAMLVTDLLDFRRVEQEDEVTLQRAGSILRRLASVMQTAVYRELGPATTAGLMNEVWSVVLAASVGGDPSVDYLERPDD